MTLNRRIGFGVTLSVDASGGSSFTTLGSIVDAPDGPDAERDTPDTSILSDTWKTFGIGQGDPGNVTCTLYYDADDATTTTINTMLYQTSQTAPNWKISFPVGSGGSGSTVSETFKGFLKKVGRKLKMKDKFMAEFTIKVSGDPGFTHS